LWYEEEEDLLKLFYSLHNGMVRAIKLRKMAWVAYVSLMRE
jgi:hypothetical protein